MLLSFFHAEGIICRNICAEAKWCLLVAGHTCHQLAVCKDLAGIQHSSLQKFCFCVCHQIDASWQAAVVAFNRKRHRKLQRANAALAIRRIQHSHAHRAGDFGFSVPQLPAVYVDLSGSFNNTGNIRTVIRYDGFRGFFLCKSQFSACLVYIQGLFFQFQFHEGFLPFPAVHVLLYEPPGCVMRECGTIFGESHAKLLEISKQRCS